MFGLEKQPKSPFTFDLEKEIKGDEKKCKELLKKIETRIEALKSTLKKGKEDEAFETYGHLLQGYASLQRVVNTIRHTL